MRFSVSKIAKMGMLVALAMALNLALIEIPNVEMISFVVFSSGYLLGLIEGGIVGFLSMFLYSVFNPFGMPTFPILLAQVTAMTLVGIAGGIVASVGWLSRAKIVNFLAVGTVGLVLTLIYDLLTNLAVAYMAGQLLPVLIGGMFFLLVHVISNTIIFTLLAPVIYRIKKSQLGSVYLEETL